MPLRRVDAHCVFRFTREVFRATAVATALVARSRGFDRPQSPPAWRAAPQMSALTLVPSPLDHAGVVTLRFVARLPRSDAFRSGVARPAIRLRAIAMRSAPHREMRAGGGVRNICNQARLPKQNFPPRPAVPHSAKYEKSARPPLLLLS